LTDISKNKKYSRYASGPDRVSPDRQEYEKKILTYIRSGLIDIKILKSDLNLYCKFIESVDVGVVTLKALTNSSTLTNFIYAHKPVICREHKNLAFLNFPLFYNNSEQLYYNLLNLRSLLKKYDFEKQNRYTETNNPFFIAQGYQIALSYNYLKSLSYRSTIGALLRYKGKDLLVCKPGLPFFDVLHGGIEKNESDEQALKREIREEVGLAVEDIGTTKLIGTFLYDKPILQQIKAGTCGAKVKVYLVDISKLPKVPTTEIDEWQYYNPKLRIFGATNKLLRSYYAKKRVKNNM